MAPQRTELTVSVRVAPKRTTPLTAIGAGVRIGPARIGPIRALVTGVRVRTVGRGGSRIGRAVARVIGPGMTVARAMSRIGLLGVMVASATARIGAVVMAGLRIVNPVCRAAVTVVAWRPTRNPR